jgi:hypothetical protein
MVRDDDHALFQLERRRNARERVEETLAHPDATETKGQRRSFLKCLPGLMRVVTPLHDSEYVITADFDRTTPCA